jgi:hypothetical protein
MIISFQILLSILLITSVIYKSISSYPILVLITLIKLLFKYFPKQLSLSNFNSKSLAIAFSSEIFTSINF